MLTFTLGRRKLQGLKGPWKSSDCPCISWFPSKPVSNWKRAWLDFRGNQGQTLLGCVFKMVPRPWWPHPRIMVILGFYIILLTSTELITHSNCSFYLWKIWKDRQGSYRWETMHHELHLYNHILRSRRSQEMVMSRFIYLLWEYRWLLKNKLFLVNLKSLAH